MTTPGIPGAAYATRIAAAQAAARAQGVRALLIGVGPELEWLTGYEAKPLERLTMLVVPAEGDSAIVTPRLEVAAAEQAPGIGSGGVRIRSWLETEDPVDLVWESVSPGPGARLVVSDTLRAAFLLRLQAAFPTPPSTSPARSSGRCGVPRMPRRWPCCGPPHRPPIGW